MKYKGLRSIAVNASFLFGAQGIRVLVRGIYAIILARFLGPELYGLFNYGLGWYLVFLPFTVLGIGTLLVREIGRDRKAGAEMVARTLALRIGLIAVTALVCGIGSWVLEGAEEIRWLLLIFTVAMVGRSLATWANSIYTAYEKTKYEFSQESTFRVLEVIVGTVALIQGANILIVATIHALTWWLQALRGVWLVHRRLTVLRLHWDWRPLRRLLFQAAPLGLVALSFNWLLQGPIILFRHIEGATSDLGQLALTLQAFFMLIAAPGSIGRASLPVLSRTVLRQDGKDEMYLQGMLRAGLLLGATVGLAGFAFGPLAVEWVFGSTYNKTGILLGPALWMLVPLTCATAANQVLLAHWRIKSAILAACFGALALTLVFPVFANRLGTLGALLATGSGFGAWALLGIIACSTFMNINWGRSLLRPGVAVILGLTTYLLLQEHSRWAAFGVSVSVLFGAAFALRTLSNSECSAIIDFARQFQHRRQ